MHCRDIQGQWQQHHHQQQVLWRQQRDLARSLHIIVESESALNKRPAAVDCNVENTCSSFHCTLLAKQVVRRPSACQAAAAAACAAPAAAAAAADFAVCVTSAPFP
jgi:hypothetical protein